ncbi:VPLPA-CTERM sorting domain-containing protein [Roseovarius sp. S1116L3]|uniref:VPLPA-CTERM sorting domain-containing protein n=1 Tax=Roseovarius roseus TaxID=3342636 RepID=UPI00372CAB4D
MNKRILSVALATFCLAPFVANATTLTYESGGFENFQIPLSDSTTPNVFLDSPGITGWVEFDSSLDEKLGKEGFKANIPYQEVSVVDYRFSNGWSTLTPSNTIFDLARISTDEFGDLKYWVFQVSFNYHYETGPGAKISSLSLQRYIAGAGALVDNYQTKARLCGGSSDPDNCGYGGLIEPYGFLHYAYTVDGSQNWTVAQSSLPGCEASGGRPPKCDGISPVPLPATFPLLGAGLAGLGFVGRRRRKDKAA